MATWIARIEVPMEAPSRQAAWSQARELAKELQGIVLSIPQEPEQAS